MSLIKPKRLTWNHIWKVAEQFRELHVNPTDLVPIPIIPIVEIDLRILPVPIQGLLEIHDIDGFLSGDLGRIFIDKKIYSDLRYENRLRFTYAHEVGHLMLHKDELGACAFENLEQWIEFRSQIHEVDLKWFEMQAYEFAGRLLVPKDRLISEIESMRETITQVKEKLGNNLTESIMAYIAIPLSRTFQVSEGVIVRRIRNEKIWEELNL